MTAATTTALTAAACARLNDANDYRVLVESPVVQITKLETRTAFEVCDFAVDQVATDDPARHNTVVTTERPGYADGDRLVRQPEVVVARHGDQP